MNRHDLWVKVDNIKRHFFLKNEIKKKILKSIKISKNITYLKRYKSNYYNSLISKSNSKSLIVNRCIISGRIWGTNKYSNYSRFIFQKKTYNAEVPGCRRSSW